jgi:DNA replication protein DnaC
MYYNTARFFDLAKLAKLQGTYYKLIKRIQKTELLILDDFGLANIDQQASN